MGVDGGVLLVPNPRALRRAASPGEGLRGWRREALVEDGALFAAGGLSVSDTGAEGDGFDDVGREEFSLAGFGC